MKFKKGDICKSSEYYNIVEILEAYTQSNTYDIIELVGKNSHIKKEVIKQDVVQIGLMKFLKLLKIILLIKSWRRYARTSSSI
jgi:hypothetical protein